MSNPATLEVSGLQVSNSTFSSSPPGSLSRATNGVISQKGVFEPRRGMAWASTMPAAADIPFALTEFQGATIAQFGTSKTDTSQGLGFVNAGALTAYSGTFNPVGDDGAATDYMRMKFAQASLFLHFCTQAGPKALETYNGTPRAAGLGRVPDFAGVTRNVFDLAMPWMPYNSSVAYRATVRRGTATGVPLISPPSSRAVVTNRILVPAGGLVRTGGNLVTASLLASQSTSLRTGDTITLTPGEADFPAGDYVVTVVNDHVFTFTSVGGNVASTVNEDADCGERAVDLAVVRIPDYALAGDTYQFWRSIATSDSTIQPSDDLYLAAEHVLTAADISAQAIVGSIDDTTPQSVLSEPLYTNPSDGDGLGLPGSNFPPPIYGDVANFDSCTWYVDTVGQQEFKMEMLGVGAPNGVQNNDTLTITDGTHTKVITFKTSPTLPTQCQITNDGTPSYNIALTAADLIRALNVSFRNVTGILAFNNSGPNDFPGKILLARDDYGAQLTVTVSRAGSWTPGFPTAGLRSTASAQANGLANSKSQEPEAVPAINYRTVGVPNFYARRIFGLRNALIILKEGDGIWSLTGSGGNYNLQQISTANTIAPDCAAVFADNVWAYTDQGILRISDSGGVQVVSRPIETALNELAIALPSETYASSFAVAYEVERRIMFFLPFAAATAATGGQPLMKAYCYSNATNAWTGPLVFNETPFSGIVSEEKHLWLGAYDGVFSRGRITEERKTGTYLDFAEAQWSNVLTTTSNPKVIQLATAGAIQKGTGISQTVNGTTWQTKVATVNGDGSYTLAETMPWVNGACTIYDPYEVEIQFLPQGDNPHIRKALTRLTTLYRPGSFANYFGVTTVETDQIQDTLEIPTPFLGFGSTPYGQGPYGNPTPMVVDSNPLAAQWANAGQFFVGFKLDEVWARLKLQGVGMMLDSAAAPVGRGR